MNISFNVRIVLEKKERKEWSEFLKNVGETLNGKPVVIFLHSLKGKHTLTIDSVILRDFLDWTKMNKYTHPMMQILSKEYHDALTNSLRKK